MPQEIEVWYLIPGIRRELAKLLIDEYKMNQKDISKILGITESAVSQYIKNKRGNEMKFSKEDMELIRKSADKIAIRNTEANREIYNLCVKFRGSESLCEFHRQHDSTIKKDCDLCC
jgi:predicted transcriptional regulator